MREKRELEIYCDLNSKEFTSFLLHFNIFLAFSDDVFEFINLINEIFMELLTI